MNKPTFLTAFTLLVAPLTFLHAQNAATSSAAPDSIVQLTAESSGLALVLPEAVPSDGTFWVVTADGVTAPMPFLPPGDQSAPVYAITSNVFLVDASGGLVNAQWLGATTTVQALATEASEVENIVMQTRTASASQPMQVMTAGMQTMDGTDGILSPDFSYPAGSLWLQITGVTNGMANLLLNNGTDQVYEVMSKADLAATNWTIEPGVLFPTNSSAMPFTVPVLNRTNALFIWAMDWTGVTENGNQTPDWWFWKYFGVLNLSDTNLDSQGNTLLYDYTNNLDPNVIQFSLNFTNNYVNSDIAYGTITVLAGAPAYMAVLINDTNQLDAVWQSYPFNRAVFNQIVTDGDL